MDKKKNFSIFIYMEKETLEQLLNNNYSLNKIAELTGKSLTTIRYWVNKHKLKSSYKTFKEQQKKIYDKVRICPKCSQEKELKEFYKKRGKDSASSYCKSCSTKQVLERTQSFKTKMVEYKGGKCIVCSYAKYYGTLEFHHLDPKEKDFNPSKFRFNTFDDKVKQELDKCVLLCANCHREVHGGIIIL